MLHSGGALLGHCVNTVLTAGTVYMQLDAKMASIGDLVQQQYARLVCG